MTKKEKEATIKAAKKVSSNMGNVSKKYRDKAPNDKSYFVTILGVNQKFVDSVPAEKQTDLKNKYHIPKTVEEGENNYYTIQINGEFYCVKQKGNFALYDKVMAYLPNGDWSRLYLDFPTIEEKKVTIPQHIVSETEPEGEFNEGDWWDKIDSNGNKVAAYCYLPNEKTDELEWQLQYNVPTNAGVGEDLGNGNERFNAYDDSGNHNTINGGSYNHAEGDGNTLNGCYAVHVDSYGNTATLVQRSSISGDRNTVTNADAVSVNGYNNNVNGNCHTVSGSGNTISGGYADIVSGQDNQVTGTDDIVSGMNNIVTASEVIVNGNGNTVNGATNSITTGDSNSNSGNRSITVGSQNTNSGANAVVGGNMNSNSGGRTGVFGDNNSNNYADDAVVCGSQNINSKSRAIMCGHAGQNSSHYFAIGNGTASSRNLAFYVDPDGTVYAEGQYNSPGADYAEYFEWADGNPSNEDRRGMLVRLEGDKIVPADGDDILGAVSFRPSVVGNSCEEHWRGKYKTDIFGDYILDENGERQLSGEYDTDMEYIPRSQRPEWAAVGMVGRLIVNDNGECIVNGFAAARNGIAVPSPSFTNIRVLKRINDTHIEILIR